MKTYDQQTKTTYHIESRISSNPTVWKRLNYFHHSDRVAAEKDIQECIARLKENGEMNYATSGIRVLEYRIAQVTSITKKEESIISTFVVNPSQAEETI